jgi:hypothetical protein
LTIEFVLRPKMMPGPPVASATVSPRKGSTFMLRRSSAVMPRQTPASSKIAERNSQLSNFRTRPCAS